MSLKAYHSAICRERLGRARFADTTGLSNRRLTYFVRYSIYTSTFLPPPHTNNRVILYGSDRMPFFFNKMICKIVHHRHAKIVRELCELPYGTGVETARTERLRKKMLTTIFPMFDGFLSISETLSGLVKKYAPKATNLKIPILVDVAISDGVKPHVSARPYIFIRVHCMSRRMAWLACLRLLP